MYDSDLALTGQVRNLAKAFSVAPEIYAAWMQLNGAIKARMDLRRYELATLAAARGLRSSYCALAHGSVLLGQFVDSQGLQAIMADHRNAGLEPVDVAVMDLADKVVTAAARCVFSKTLDALGVEPDASYSDLEPDLRSALTVRRGIAAQS